MASKTVAGPNAAGHPKNGSVITGAPSAVAINQAGILFNEIATLANSLDREFYFQPPVNDRRLEEINLELDRLRAAIRQIGWMADAGADKVGDMTARGGAEEWMLPPVYQDREVSHG